MRNSPKDQEEIAMYASEKIESKGRKSSTKLEILRIINTLNFFIFIFKIIHLLLELIAII